MTPAKYSVAALLGIVLLLAIYGAYQYPKASISASTTPQGGTTSTAHFYSVAVNLAAPGANATTSSILNPSQNDYYVSSVKVGCENIGKSFAYGGVTGLAALQVTAATSSTANPAVNGNANSIGGAAVTIGTSTLQYAISSAAIASGSGNPFVVWGAGTYMTFTTNATNTAMCTFGVEAFSS